MPDNLFVIIKDDGIQDLKLMQGGISSAEKEQWLKDAYERIRAKEQNTSPNLYVKVL
jgi:hypothetical protein